jgi:alpha-galactosidase
VVHPDAVDPALRVRGVVAPDGSEAVFTVATVASLEDALPERVRLDGLDPERRYTLRVRDEIGAAKHGWTTPPWLGKDAVTVPGRVLGEVGLQLPGLWPVQAVMIHLTAE